MKIKTFPSSQQMILFLPIPLSYKWTTASSVHSSCTNPQLMLTSAKIFNHEGFEQSIPKWPLGDRHSREEVTITF